MDDKRAVYLVILTDRWEIDYFPEEAWYSEEIANKRAKELTETYSDKSGDYFYVVRKTEIKDGEPI